MTKEATATTTELREILPVKSTAVTVDHCDFRTKSVVVDLDDSLTPADLYADPSLWRVVQKSRDKALNALDSVALIWFDKAVYTHVDFADDKEVVLFKAPVLARRDRERTPWQNETYEVRAVAGQWSFFRRKDGVQMSGKTYSTPELARQACIVETGSVRV